jgi:hypothetical protein
MPAAVEKLALIIGALAKIEATYGAATALAAATDGFLLAELADLNEDFAHDGERASPPGTTGHLPRGLPAGSFVETTLKAEPKGAGVAYSAAVKPPEDVLMRASGHDAAVTLTGGAEKYVYTPTPGQSTFASAALGLYSRGGLWTLKGAMADWSWGFDGPKTPMSEYAVKALFTSFADVAAPAIAYPAPDVIPSPAATVLFIIGGVSTLSVRKMQFKAGRGLGSRLDCNAGGHAGFTGSRRKPMLEVTIEEPLTTTYDARLKRRTAVQEALSFQVGSVQYNREKFAAPKAQLVTVKPGTDGDVATLVLTYQLNPSVISASDEYSRTFD